MRSFEIKVMVAGVEYGEDSIVSCSAGGCTFDGLTIGNCVSREIDLSIRHPGVVPRMARIDVFYHPTSGGEWRPHGVYFVDTREMEEDTGILSLHGFDAMMKSLSVWWDPSEDAGEWPMSQMAAAEDIAAMMGTSVDPMTVINPSYKVEYPNDLTMQEVLGFIATANNGNWIMSDSGKLLLMPVGSAPPETHLLVDNEDGGAILFGEVRIIV